MDNTTSNSKFNFIFKVIRLIKGTVKALKPQQIPFSRYVYVNSFSIFILQQRTFNVKESLEAFPFARDCATIVNNTVLICKHANIFESTLILMLAIFLSK